MMINEFSVTNGLFLSGFARIWDVFRLVGHFSFLLIVFLFFSANAGDFGGFFWYGSFSFIENSSNKKMQIFRICIINVNIL
jgi:hypothetical protein